MDRYPSGGLVIQVRIRRLFNRKSLLLQLAAMEFVTLKGIDAMVLCLHAYHFNLGIL